VAILCFLLSAYRLSAQSSTQNYVQTVVTRVPGLTTSSAISAHPDTAHEIIAIQYFDGLERLIQTIQKNASTTGRDIVQPVTYDQYGRDSIKYLPYTASLATSDGSFKSTAVADQLTFYHPSGSTSGTQQSNGIINTASPYARTGYEPSPLNRIVEQGAPGDAWQFTGAGNNNSNNHTIRTVDTTNDTTSTFSSSNNIGSKIAALYTTTINNATQTQQLTRVGNAVYGAGQLYVTITRDENWQPAYGVVGTTETYTDKEGHIVLKRIYNYIGTAVQELSTYYVYDVLGNLAFVLPPSAGGDNAGIPSQLVLDNLCYQYQYDQRNRMVAKKIPGKGWEYMVYNTLDQLIATQDSVERSTTPQKVSYIKYDGQGRVIITGYYALSGSVLGTNYRATLQASADAQTTLWETKSTAGVYSNVTIPTSGAVMYTTNYYDDYIISGIPTNYKLTSGVSTMTKGLLTANKVAVLNTPADVLWTVNYYDDRGRDTLTFKQHYLGGHNAYSLNNYDHISTHYSFINQVDTVVRMHFTKASLSIPNVTIGNRYTYDHVGRKTKTGELIYAGATAGPMTYLSKLDYNEIGQMIGKHYHSTDSVNYLGEALYAYNERGWLTSITPVGITYFGETINYNNPSSGGLGTATPQYNGNISQFIYNSPNMEGHFGSDPHSSNIVNYGYDALNRLAASQSTVTANGDESATYDLEGNITSLTRTGPNAATLAYTYNTNSNQLHLVNNGATPVKVYTYDGNGNVTSDSTGKSITYNLLNLPLVVKKSSSVTLATYYYDANGRKLRDTSMSAHTSWDYVDGIVYQYNSTLNTSTISFIQTEEGKATLISPNPAFTYTYDFKDYLGNIRASFDNGGTGGTPRVVQEDDYYPFGLDKKYYDLSNGNRYLYNGKEKQTDLANEYDYGARFYDPVIARWTSVDPMAEQGRRWTPYGYGFDDPIRFEDPDGMWPDWSDIESKALSVVAKVAVVYIQTNRQVSNGITDVLGLPRSEEVVKVVSGQATSKEKSEFTDKMVSAFQGMLLGGEEGGEGFHGEGPKLEMPEPKEGSSGGPGAGKRFSKSTQSAAKAETNGKCIFCGEKTDTGEPGKKGNTDHSDPKSKGGNNTLNNAQHTCQSCNLEKGAKTTKEYLDYKKNK